MIEHRCRRPQTWWTSSVTPEVQTTKPRTRRGTFNFIGSFSNTLFGTATESQVKEMHETVQNALLLGKTQEHLKFISTRFNSFVSMTTQQLRDLQHHVDRLNTRVDILDIIDDMITCVEIICQAMTFGVRVPNLLDSQNNYFPLMCCAMYCPRTYLLALNL